LVEGIVLVLGDAAVGARELLHQRIDAVVGVRKRVCPALDLRQAVEGVVDVVDRRAALRDHLRDAAQVVGHVEGAKESGLK
jgi:hypothetical protein